VSTGLAETTGLRASSRSVRGCLQQDVRIDDGRHILVTDEPERCGGGDAGPAPHELFAAALASCVSTTVQMYAQARGWEIGDVRVDVDYDHCSTPGRFSIVLHLDPSLPRDDVEQLTRVAETCPLRRAIEGGIVFDERVVLDSPRGRRGWPLGAA
jgi:putative redox protein